MPIGPFSDVRVSWRPRTERLNRVMLGDQVASDASLISKEEKDYRENVAAQKAELAKQSVENRRREVLERQSGPPDKSESLTSVGAELTAQQEAERKRQEDAQAALDYERTHGGIGFKVFNVEKPLPLFVRYKWPILIGGAIAIGLFLRRKV